MYLYYDSFDYTTWLELTVVWKDHYHHHHYHLLLYNAHLYYISFYSYKFCSASWNTYHHFQWHSLLDEPKQTASQSTKNWISSHWHKTTASQIFWSNKLISQQWYHPSQFLCSQSWLHLWLWHVFLWINQLCIQILSFLYPRHPSNSSSSTPLSLQPQLLQIHVSPANLTIAIHFTLASQKQISTNFNAFKIHWHVSLQIFQNINTSHQHSKNYTGFLSNKESITKSVFSHKTLTNQQPTYLYNSLSFPSHSVSTRSSDSLVLSIPYVRSSLGIGKRAFSVIGPRLWNSLPPDTRNSFSLPIFHSRLKTHLFKIMFPP